MIEEDTIKLLRECDSGIKMGVQAIDEVLSYVKNEDYKTNLTRCKKEHESLKNEINTLLNKYQDEGKNPNIMVQGMSWMKTNFKLMTKEDDSTIADLIVDGCNMGVKSLYKYLNKYQAADKKTKDIVKRLIDLEDLLSKESRKYL